ncbi:MAG: polyphosphate kinase 1 [Lachnospiraceae bacterium]|nr:polyphosphate kinase 1 [Lachnospiraceae bacterium]
MKKEKKSRQGSEVLTPAVVFTNRELSWLAFNERVLEEAARKDIPFAERLSFLAIYQSNLDEFFRVRVGTLTDQDLLDEKVRENKTNMTPQEQLTAIMETVRRLNRRKDEIYAELMLNLEDKGIRVVDFHKISAMQSAHLENYFDQTVALLLSPMIVGKRQPMPFLRNYEIYAIASMRSKKGKNGSKKTGIISCAANVLPRLIPVPGEANTYVLSEELILHCIDHVFKNYEIESKSLVRLTRNADIDPDALFDESEDYREFMSELMKKRNKLTPVRMEFSRELGIDLISSLCKELKVDEKNVFRNSTPLDLSYLFQLKDCLHDQKDLFYKYRSPQKTTQFRRRESLMEQVMQEDKLLSYPYDSMEPFLNLLFEAADNPEVLSIKMTLYRLAPNSRIVEALIAAAENGKDVEVLVELKARFDEENNIEWSRRLERAGCHVIYGLNGYKVHSKLCLITGLRDSEIYYISHVGTGNFNEKTAKLYTDYALLTANKGIGENVAEIFQALSQEETVEESQYLLAAPNCLQNRLIALMDEEIAHAQSGEDAYIGIKINSLTDKTLILKLIEASKAGVKIEMIVRGICCLKPGVKNETENIRVISIVGRFLEHSRVYIFGTGEREKIYISSADFMTRNTLRRVEVATPVFDTSIKNKLRTMFNSMLQDNCQAWELQWDGSYCRVENTDAPMNAQEHFYELAYEEAAEKKTTAAKV